VSAVSGLEGAPFPGPWAGRGACRRLPSQIFFPTRGEDLDAARAVCGACPVSEKCRDYALAIPGLRGVWGGLSEREREQLRQDGVVDTPEPEPEVKEPAPSVVRPRAADGSLLAVLEVVAARPGCWARVGRFGSRYSGSSTASLLRNGRRPVPPGRWRFEGRRNDDGTSELWARYEGPDDGSDAERSA
jgi:WhiB family redox-sensing transcriptional regulator